MKQYKLIKKFPECRLEIGDIVTQDEYDQYVSEDITIFHQYDVEDFPEFWEPIEVKNYKVLSIKWENNEQTIKFREDYRYEDYNWGSKWKIHSVRRLSDGEVFSVGDNVHCFNEGGKIYKFELKENNLFVHFNDNRSTYQKEWCNINNINHPKQPIFTTEDSVDVYEGDTYYVVSKSRTPITMIAYDVELSTNIKRFSTKEKAQEWIDNNKPRYSRRDIETAFYGNQRGASPMCCYIDEVGFWEALDE